MRSACLLATGVGKAVASPAAGRLYLGINDKDEGLADKVGSITVERLSRSIGSPDTTLDWKQLKRKGDQP
jgi:hypothetical protein